jgi:hypothetical protein
MRYSIRVVFDRRKRAILGRAWPRLIKNLDWCFIKLFGLSGEFD